MASAVIHDNHIAFNGVDYFRGHAESVELGSYGEKRSPLAKANYLEVKGQVPLDELEFRRATIVEIDTSKSKQSDVDLNLKVASGDSGEVHGAFNKIKSHELELVKLELDRPHLKKAVNHTSRVLDNLRNYGHDARICDQIFVVMEAKEAEQFARSGSLKLSKGNKGAKLTASGSVQGSGSTSITLSAGTTYAYLLCKLDWERGKDRVEDFNDDQWGTS